MHKVTHVVFDLDGVLLDTETTIMKFYGATLASFGKAFTDEIRMNVTGKKRLPGMEVIIKMAGLTGKVTAEEFNAKYEQISGDAVAECPLMPGALRLVEHLAKHNVPRAIYTSSERTEFFVKMRKHSRVLDIVPIVVLGDDPEVREGKPAPDGYLTAMRRLKPPAATPKDVLVFEDSPSGVRAGLAAGATVIMVIEPHAATEEHKKLHDSVATTLGSLSDFKPESFGLPPY